MKNEFFLEGQNLKQAFLPVDLNTAAVTGNRVSMANSERIAIVISMGDSAGATAEFTLKQHDAATAGNSKNLSIDNKYYVKAGAATSFTQVEPSSAAAVYDLSADFAAQEGVVVFQVLAQDLDLANGYNHISVDVTDSAAAKIGAGIYILSNCRNLPAYSEAV